MRRLRPSAQIRSRLEDVRTQVDIEYFRGFDLVLSMVNDDAADEHISRMCVAASVPMVAVGATADSGQVTATAGGHPPDGQTGRPPYSITHLLTRSLKQLAYREPCQRVGPPKSCEKGKIARCPDYLSKQPSQYNL